MTITTYKTGSTERRRAAQDIEEFLRLASERIDNKPDAIPFKSEQGKLVISWLFALAARHSDGEDIGGKDV